jgi:anaerobic selenocysteine-containing dehydrogenase
MKITRKKLLLATAASAAGAIASRTGLINSLIAGQNDKAQVAGEWRSSVCQGCTSWCPIQAYVINGRVVKVRGNPNCKSTLGQICQKPHLAIQQMYDPDRVKVPMKRTNPVKGRHENPKFVPISWDEAMNTIADKILELKKKNETEKFALFRGRYTHMNDLIYYAFPKFIGSPNNISHSSICAEAEKFGPYYTEGLWDYRNYDLDNTKYILCWGADPISSNRMTGWAISKWGAVLDQAKVVVIDPRLSATASKAHDWLPVIPGEDAAIGVAMAHTILVNGLWSREFVGDFIDGTNKFIIGQDVDERFFAERETSGLVKWWNLELKDKTPQWAAKKAGVPADKIEKIAIEFAKAAPSVISWLSPGPVMTPRGGYTSMVLTALNGLVGSCDSKGGTLHSMKVPYKSFPKMDDYIDEKAKKAGKAKKIDQRGSLKFPALNKKTGGGVVTNNVADAMLTKKPYELKMAIGYWNNFVFSATGAERWEKAMSALPFYVHITTNAAEMTQFADIVLPAAFHMFERWGYVRCFQNRHSYAALHQPVVKPLYDVRTDETEIPFMLAQALAKKGDTGMLKYFQEQFKDPETGKTPETAAEFALFSVKNITEPFWTGKTEKEGDVITSWKEFTEKGVWNTKEYKFKKNWGKFKTETKKYEFYSETLKKVLTEHAEKHKVSIDKAIESADYAARGEIAFIPHYEAPIRVGDEKDFPLIFLEHRSRHNREGRSANVSMYHEFKSCDPGDVSGSDVTKINPIDAAKLGLKNNDCIKLVSTTGSLESTVRIWEAVRPGTVIKCYGQGHWAYGSIASADYKGQKARGGNNNLLHSSQYERLSSSTARHGGFTRVKIVKG